MNGTSPDDAVQQQLLDLLQKLEDPAHESLLPEALLDYHLAKGGVDPAGLPRSAKNLLSLVTEKFVLDIVTDAAGYSKMRSGSSSSSSAASGPTKLSIEDLQAALADRDISIKRPPYHL